MRPDVRRSAARLRDGPDDGQPEPGAAAGAGLVRAGEALEGVRDEGGREPGSAIVDVDLDAVVRDARREPHRRRAVPERVVDHVADRLVELERVGVHEEPVGKVGLDPAPAELGASPEAADDGRADRADARRGVRGGKLSVVALRPMRACPGWRSAHRP